METDRTTIYRKSARYLSELFSSVQVLPNTDTNPASSCSEMYSITEGTETVETVESVRDGFSHTQECAHSMVFLYKSRANWILLNTHSPDSFTEVSSRLTNS